MNKKMRYSDFTEPTELVVQLGTLLDPESKVLDLGAGQGANALYLAGLGHEVLAVEKEDSELHVLREKNNEADKRIEIVQADILDFENDQQFDAVVADMVLHFFERDDVARTIEKMQSLTCHGGFNLVSGYSYKNEEGKRPYLFQQNELPGFYEGWEIVSYEEKPTPWFVHPPGTPKRRNEAVYLIARKL